MIYFFSMRIVTILSSSSPMSCQQNKRNKKFKWNKVFFFHRLWKTFPFKAFVPCQLLCTFFFFYCFVNFVHKFLIMKTRKEINDAKTIKHKGIKWDIESVVYSYSCVVCWMWILKCNCSYTIHIHIMK